MKQSLAIILTFTFLFSPVSVFAGPTPTVTNFTYSPTGNITSKSDVGAYEYTDTRHPHAATKVGTSIFTYDKNGSLISDGSGTYTYDYANRLSTVTGTNGATTYIYDDSTNRIQKRLANGGRVSYVGQETETDEAGRATDYIFAGSDRLLTIDPTEGVLYNIEDHLSSASLIVKGGTIVQKLDYYQYGTERVNEKTTSFGARHTFTDKEKDTESGLQYFGARYYRPTIGRFTQIDPLEGNIFDPQSLNRYAYSRNNPIVYLFPDGSSFTTGLLGTATPLTYMYNHPVETAGFALVAGATALVAPIAVAVVGVGLSAYATGNALSNAYNAPDTDTRDYYLGQATTFGALTALGVKGAGEVGAPAKNFAGAREDRKSVV